MKEEFNLSEKIGKGVMEHHIHIQDIKEFIKKLKEEKDMNVSDAVRLLNDKKNLNYWMIELMWKFGRYQKYLQIKEKAGENLI